VALRLDPGRPGDPRRSCCSAAYRRQPGEQSKAYDTAIRVYDPRIDGWRVTVVAPVSGATVNLIAREHGDQIWLEGRSPDNSLLRWTFSEFSGQRVRWQGFVSKTRASPGSAMRRSSFSATRSW
jgi:hypothetical protein